MRALDFPDGYSGKPNTRERSMLYETGRDKHSIASVFFMEPGCG